MTGRPALSAVLAAQDGVRGWQESLYRDLHQHPELSHAEQRTAAAVAKQLETSGFDVTTGVGGTGVVGVLRHGEGACVLLRADMDALPVRETTGLSYASTETVDDASGASTPVAHACGHDMHTTCLLGAADLLAAGRDHWTGTLAVVFQPAEETGDGAEGMVSDGLRERLPAVDVALAQHVVPMPAGLVATRPGPSFAAADSMRITVYGRGGHGSMPHVTVDPVVLAAAIVMRLQTLVAREIEPGEPAVVTVGSIEAGTKSNIIPDRAVLELNIRTYDAQVRENLLAAIHRVVAAECAASNSPREPEFELYDRFPLTTNDAAVTARVAAAFRDAFGDRAQPAPRATASEDFSDIPNGLDVPYTYWVFGGVDPQRFSDAEKAGRIAQDIPANHSPDFAPVIQPTLDTGTQTMVTAALAWLAP
ncbi:amidohydrolase [Actinomycetospora sp. C-140]